MSTVERLVVAGRSGLRVMLAPGCWEYLKERSSTRCASIRMRCSEGVGRADIVGSERHHQRLASPWQTFTIYVYRLSTEASNKNCLNTWPRPCSVSRTDTDEYDEDTKYSPFYLTRVEQAKWRRASLHLSEPASSLQATARQTRS